MSIQRIPITTAIDPEAYTYASNTLTLNGSLAKNAIYSKYPDGRLYATQRPNLTILQNASASGVTNKGRGLYYWSAASSLIIVNNDTVYVGDYAHLQSTHITTGTEPVYFAEVGDKLIILVPDGGSFGTGYICSVVSSFVITITLISDPNFPPNQSPPKSLAGGGVSLDGYLFVLTKDKFIWNSAQYDASSWDALDFIRAEREIDTGVYLGKHHDHLIALGTRSIEFFYDAGNPVGSPLTRREDVAYRIGPYNPRAVFSTDDNLYFLGSEKQGSMSLFKISQFTPTKLSDQSMDQLFASLGSFGSSDVVGSMLSGFFTESHGLLFITFFTGGLGSPILEKYTIIYDTSTGLFSQFQTSAASITQFGVISTTYNSLTGIGFSTNATLLFSTGDLASFTYETTKQDTQALNTKIPFEFIIRTVESDLGTVTNKFVERMSVVGTTISGGTDASPLYVSWSNDHYKDFTAERQLHTGLNRSLTRGGKFKRRAYQLRYVGTDTLRIEGIELDVRASQYA